ncbi:endonuclease/exonuclease/phosphatase family protein [Vibrio hannami]|uniref:endonuclease/exonuclease/phosphatase family protein n=1 Tax=Vibrio hannami TaxID=2717094 RepID=UPI00240F02F4|nr:endonuclease/exonuclease/phosphatase family protein [Vibrio hannami]MDG3085441.1 endonuclease/exonuclease/phosphatase family protein [Vibrio hannami]
MRNTILLKITRWTSLFCIYLLSIGTVYAGQLSIASWNLEWLTSSPIERFPQSQRSRQDFQALQSYFTRMSPDILAFQEVNDVESIKKLVGLDYKIMLSERSETTYSSHQFSDINQYTGFAYRSSLIIKSYPSLHLASTPSTKLRFASHLSVRTEQGEVHLLSVHLKAGCRGKYKNNRSCRSLKSEAEGINQWISERIKRKQKFIVVGDFNHNLSYKNDWLFNVISKGVSSQTELKTRNTKSHCYVRSNKQKRKLHSYRSLIDHIISSKDLEMNLPYQFLYDESDLHRYQLSDHCPLVSAFDI